MAGSALYRADDMAAEVERIRSIAARGPGRDARRLGRSRAGAAPAGDARRRPRRRREIAAIDGGLLVLLGVGHGDDDATADALARRICELRIFEDEDGKTNRSLLDVGGACLLVSQFTLYADTRRGRRPASPTRRLTSHHQGLRLGGMRRCRRRRTALAAPAARSRSRCRAAILPSNGARATTMC